MHVTFYKGLQFIGGILMKRVLKNNIFLDRLTGIPNFFKFIECDINLTFGDYGTVVIFDMIAFEKINRGYGRDIGDTCLKVMAKVICDYLHKEEGTSIFRTDGDEFTAILPKIEHYRGRELAINIKANFKKQMMKQGLDDIDVRYFIIEYNHSLNSIDEFYQMIFEYSIGNINCSDEKFIQERWVGHIIGSFTKRIKETLSLLDDAYKLALTDDISGLPNNRAAKLYLSNLLKENEGISEFSALFIDGDNLKRYNNISYEAGNDMIEKLSAVIKATLRKEDKVFRWLSGDEFLVILEKTNYEDTLRLAERIRDTVEERTVNWLYPVTVSIGVASYPEDGTIIEDIIEKAERANSLAKSSGKNKVVRWVLQA